LDGEGRKMSKSLGNVVDPNQIANTLGADIFRLWVASVDYQSDVRLSDDLVKQVSESYRKIRNTFKFLLGNLEDFNPANDLVEYQKLDEIDQYMLIKTNRFVKESLAAYSDFSFDDVYRMATNFVTFISAFYLDFAKDVLYIERADDPKRRKMQTVLYRMLDSLLKILTPLIPHTTSEAYDYLPYREKGDVYLMDMPAVEDYPLDIEPLYDQFMVLRESVLKALEIARNEKVIGKSLNAHLILYPKGQYDTLLDRLSINLAQVFIVSRAEIRKEGYGSFKADEISIDVLPAQGITCSRCWSVVDHVGDDELCPRCHQIVESLK
jgi:isoleucyl-tRNA synthetase